MKRPTSPLRLRLQRSGEVLRSISEDDLASRSWRRNGICENHFEHCKNIENKLVSKGLRGKADLSNDRFNNKIRKAQQMKIPLMIIIGDKEVENNSLTIRLRNGKNLNDIKIESLIKIFEENSKINNDDGLKAVFEEI